MAMKAGLGELIRTIGLDGSYGIAMREQVDSEALMAESSRVIIITADMRYVLQRRALEKRVYPGHWDFGVGETSRPGESGEEVAIRGLEEELGMRNVSKDELRHLGQFDYSDAVMKRRVSVFLLVYDGQRHGQIHPQPAEVSEVRFVKQEELEGIIATAVFSPLGKYAYEKIICPDKALYTSQYS